MISLNSDTIFYYSPPALVFILFFLFSLENFAQDSTEILNSSFQEFKDSLLVQSNNAPSQKSIKYKKLNTQENIYSENNRKKIFDDSTRNSPKNAALLGLAFPGLGQVYNKKYWKLPIVYASIGGCIFWVIRQARSTKEFNQYLVQRANGIALPPIIERYSTTQLETIRNSHRRSVQMASFVTVMVWGFSILDAAVDAHIKPFDISDKLSMQIKPNMMQQNQNYYAALQIKLNLK